VRGPDHPWIDCSDDPIYVWTFPSTATDEEVQACCDVRERWAKTAMHPCAWVVDLRELLRVPPAQRKLFAAHLKRFEHHDVKFNRGSGIVLSNAWLRGIVSAVFMLSPPKFPNKTFATVEDARRWAREQLDAAR
jgi:hypothetical protein